MPLYDFKCPVCPEHIELFIRKADSADGAEVGCQKCGATMERQLSVFGSYKIQGNNSASVTPKKYRGEQ